VGPARSVPIRQSPQRADPLLPAAPLRAAGITGWAQINYKYGDSLQDTITKLEYDLYYIKNMSLAWTTTSSSTP